MHICQHKNVREELALPPHHAKITCSDCGKFLGFARKPENIGVKRPASHKGLVEMYSRGYCEMCLRSKEKLPISECLEAHHIRPYQYDGDSDRSNIWIVCTPCHRIIEHMRTYLGHYGGQFKFPV